MKRSSALAPLSRDHQHALDAALPLRRAGPDAIVEALDHFRRFFDEEGRRHFEIEEELVLPALPADDEEWGRAVRRVREDHEAIRAAAWGLREVRPSREAVDAARALRERLHAHVRFEERTLFAILGRRLSPAELERVGAAVAHAEEGR